jgi:hypothetical protein
MITLLKLLIGNMVLNIVHAYASHIGLDALDALVKIVINWMHCSILCLPQKVLRRRSQWPCRSF